MPHACTVMHACMYSSVVCMCISAGLMAGYSVATYQLTDSQFPVLPVSVMDPQAVHQQAVIDRKLINPQQETAYKTPCI